MTVHYHPLTKEPYLRLPEPHSNIIITPHRRDQLDETVLRLVGLLNDPRIYQWLESTPYPYLREHGEQWVKDSCKEIEQVLSTLQGELAENKDSYSSDHATTDAQSQRTFFDVCPFTCIREVLTADAETGAPLKDILIGDIKLGRYTFYELGLASEERVEAQRKNNSLPAGDEKIAWTLGDYLAPSHHGKGIMTLAIQTVIQDWAVPYMNICDLRCYAFQGNQGSLRVFEKNNFEELCVLEDWVPVAEYRGGGRKSIVMMKWKGLS